MTDNKHKKHIDELSGIETTGHEWDGLKELNNPLPRWWLWVFYACVAWAVYYFIVFPAWPTISGKTGATEGTSGYTQYKELRQSQNEIFARQAAYLDRFEKASFDQIMNDPALYAFAIAGGHAAFKDNCATCHGSGAQGGFGYPNLNDDDWLWGGTLEDIHTTLEHGVRKPDDWDTRQSQMPAFGKDDLLERADIESVVKYVMALSEPGDHSDMAGYAIFQENCAACHGEDGKGTRELGAPNLTDAIWLYGGDHDTIYETVYNARGGIMPAWSGRLSENTIRQLAIYVHELGGGESDVADAQDNVESPMDKAVDIIEDAGAAVSEEASEMSDDAADMAKDAVEAVKEDAVEAIDAAEDTVDAVEDEAEDIKDHMMHE